MSTSIVILDTNILAHSPFLDSDEWNQLHVHTTDWGGSASWCPKSRSWKR